MPASLPLAKAAVMMVLALSRLMRKSLMGGCSLYIVSYTGLTEKAGREKPPRERECAQNKNNVAICRRMDPRDFRMARKTQIVVVGGGAAGLELATRLGAHFGREHFDIILVEKSRTHIWKPLLHEVAAGALDANLDEVGYRSHGHAWGYRFFYGTMEGVDRDSRHVLIAPILDEDGAEIMGRHRIRYDYLVLAVGSVSNDFGTKGVAQHCIFLDSRPQADRFRTKLLDHCLRVSRTLVQNPDADARGAGRHCGRRRHRRRTGGRAIQCRGGAAPLWAGSVRRKPDEGDPDRSGPAHPARAARKAGRGRAQGTGSLGVRVRHRRAGGGSHQRRHDHQVGRVDQSRSASLGGWCEGADMLAGLGLETTRSNQLVVKPTLQTTRDDRIFAIGDCAWFVPEGETRPVPPRAQAAHQMAATAFHNIRA